MKNQYYNIAGVCSSKKGLNCFLEQTSPAFKNFLNFLGERIELKGWKGYRAGLDINDNQTGSHSYYTKWQGYEIMFHVSPLLPFQDS
jgi:RAP1 GTPase activating protein 1